jgi:hypothetical protein
MVFRNGNALNLQRKSFLRMLKHRTSDTSEIFDLEIKGKFRRFGICSVSPTIGINRREFRELPTSWRFQPWHKKDRHGASYQRIVCQSECRSRVGSSCARLKTRDDPPASVEARDQPSIQPLDTLACLRLFRDAQIMCFLCASDTVRVGRGSSLPRVHSHFDDAQELRAGGAVGLRHRGCPG